LAARKLKRATQAKSQILPRSAEAELTAQVNSPVRPEGRAPALEKLRYACFQLILGTGEAPPAARAGERAAALASGGQGVCPWNPTGNVPDRIGGFAAFTPRRKE